MGSLQSYWNYSPGVSWFFILEYLWPLQNLRISESRFFILESSGPLQNLRISKIIPECWREFEFFWISYQKIDLFAHQIKLHTFSHLYIACICPGGLSTHNTLPHCPGRGPIFHWGAPRCHWGATPATGVHRVDHEIGRGATKPTRYAKFGRDGNVISKIRVGCTPRAWKGW